MSPSDVNAPNHDPHSNDQLHNLQLRKPPSVSTIDGADAPSNQDSFHLLHATYGCAQASSVMPILHQPPSIPPLANRRLRVTRIKLTTTETRIRELFDGFQVESVTIIPGVKGWVPKEAIITMRTRREAVAAMEDFRLIQEEAGVEQRARMITVEWA